MPRHPVATGPRIALSSNAIVGLMCAGMAVFMLGLACVCGSLMRADAAMMAVAHAKICLVPRSPGKVSAAPPRARGH